MNKQLSSFFAAGRALGLIEANLPADVSLHDAPSVTPRQVAAIVNGVAIELTLPEVSDDGKELLPLCAGLVAAKRASIDRDVKANHKQLQNLIGGTSGYPPARLKIFFVPILPARFERPAGLATATPDVRARFAYLYGSQ